MKNRHIIFLIMVIIALCGIILSVSYALNVNVTENTTSDYDLSYTFDISDNATWTINVEANKTKVYDISITNPYNDLIQYGVVYKLESPTSMPSGSLVGILNTSKYSPLDLIEVNNTRDVSIFISNNSDSNMQVSLSIVTGYKNGGELIIPDGYKIITSKFNDFTGAAYKIANIFYNSTKSEFTSENGINYTYSEDNNMIEDAYGNIRYYGATPNNYIYFNCNDYSNQTSDTCELWRIIGVVDGKVKIMRNEIIGEYSWDNKNKDTGSDNDNGSNDWSNSRLMKLLNSSEYYITDSNDYGYGQSLYWNSESGSCFSGNNNGKKSCDFTSTGIKNDITRNMISEFKYYLRTPKKEYSSSSFYADELYYNERYGGVLPNKKNASYWVGKVALPYASDYAYAVDLSSCNYKINEYNKCVNTNWMFPICSSYYTWLLTPSEGTSFTAFTVFRWRPPVQGQVFVNAAGLINDEFVTYSSWGVIPALYLNDYLDIKEGTGTSSNPYQLKVNDITQYTVSYDANGGDGAPSSQIKYENENLSLSSIVPTKIGYTFTGWNTKSDGTGTNYSSGGTYSDNSNVTLYAMWTSVSSYNVTIYLQGELVNNYTVTPGDDLVTRFGVESNEPLRYMTCTNGASITSSVGYVNNLTVANVTVTNITNDTVCNLYYTLV